VIPTLGGTERRITDGWACDWTNDGKSIVVGNMEKGARTLSVAEIESGNTVRLPDLAGGLGPTVTQRLGGSVRLSKDGQWLYASAEKSPTESSLHRLAFPGGKAWEPVQLAGVVSIVSFDVSPDGSELVLMGRSGPHERTRPFRVSSSGGTVKPLPFGEGGSNIAWAPKGDMLAFVSSIRVQALYRIPIPIRQGAAVQPERIIVSRFIEGTPVFSPDGKSVAVSSDRNGVMQIYRSDADGNNSIQLTKLFGVTVGSPAWSPDGQRILFDARVGGNPDIWVMNFDGSNPKRVTSDPAEDVTPAWTPDGKSVVFCSNRGGDQQLWRMPVGGDSAVQLTREGGFAPQLSPDGKYFHYLRYRSSGGLRRIPVEGGREEDLIPSVRDRNWVATSEGIYIFQMGSGATGMYGTNQPAELVYYDFRTKRLNRTGFTTPQRIGNNGIAVSPDGQRLLFPQLDESGSGIMIVEHFR
jgi:Tol biopolymer transport system component